MIDAERDKIIEWLEAVRKRALLIFNTSESAGGHQESVGSGGQKWQVADRQEIPRGPLAMSEVNRIIRRLQPLFDNDAVKLATMLSSGRCDLALMPIPHKYFRHWSVEGGHEKIDDSGHGALFLLGNAATYYLSVLHSLDSANELALNHVAFHLGRAALENEWQWIVRSPVRNLGPSGRKVIHAGPLELRFLTKAEEKLERERSGTGLVFPTWSFVYEGRAARRPMILRTRPSYLTVRVTGPYPQRERERSGALDELRRGDRAEALLYAALLALQLLGYEPEGDGHMSQNTYPYWLLNATKTRPISLPPSRPGFKECWVPEERLCRVEELASRIPDGTFTGSQEYVQVALRRFHNAVNLGDSSAGLLEHIAALESMLDMRTIRNRWRVRARVCPTELGNLIAVHAAELWDLYKLRSKTVHGEIEPSDKCIAHAVTRARQIAAELLCATLRVEYRPYSGRMEGDFWREPFLITAYYPAIRRQDS